MTSDSEIVTFTLLGQTFRIRAGHEQAVRARRVADGLNKRLAAEGAGVDLRSALMAAYGTAYELDEVTEALNTAKSAYALRVESARSVMDRLLNQVDAELGVVPTEEIAADDAVEEIPVAEPMLVVEEEPEPVIASEPEAMEEAVPPMIEEAAPLAESAPDEPPVIQAEVSSDESVDDEGHESETEEEKIARKAHTSRKAKPNEPDMFNAMFAPPPENFHEDPRSMEP
ncbi:TPA: hypothetical protein DDW35_10445 [Candidatus Sumerlaeota bacterium]|jgi:hypothetical protein|nr:hypothetical protein [Candidatus Sumerlaeota bacterium]